MSDVDVVAKAALQQGGRGVMARSTITGVGGLVLVADPAGTVGGVAAGLALVGSGVTGLMLAVPGAAAVMGAAAAVYIAWLAWRIATAPPLGAQAAARPPSAVAGFLLALANPKAYAAMAALFSGFVLIPARPGLDAGLTALLLVAIMLALTTDYIPEKREVFGVASPPGKGVATDPQAR